MRRSQRRGLVAAGLLLYASCAMAPVESTPQPQAAPGPLASVAGTWNMRTLSMEGDSVLATYRIEATAGRSGWTLTFPGRDPIPMEVRELSGDRIVVDAGPYPSALREGVTVRTRFTMRLRGDRMSGEIRAVYRMPEGETTVPLRVEGTRAR